MTSFLERVRQFDAEKARRNGNTPPPPVNGAPIRTDRHTTYGAAALAHEIDNVASATVGTRNDTLNKAAFNIGQLINAGHIDERDAHHQLRQAALFAGLTEYEVDATLQSAGTGAGKKPRTTAPDPADDTSPAPAVTTIDMSPTEADDLSALVRRTFPAIDWHELWARPDEDEDWIVEPLLPARRLIALYSAPKVGKSLLMIELAAAVATGRHVLGAPTTQQRVLYVDFENDPAQDTRERLKAMGYGPGDLDNLVMLSFPTLAALDSAQGANELMLAVVEYRCKVVVIDTVSRAVKGDENDNDTWLDFYRHTGLKLKQAGAALVRLDHTGKDPAKGQRGGSAKSGDVDAVWRLEAVSDDTYRLHCDDVRFRLLERDVVYTRQQHPLASVVDANSRRAVWDAKVRDIRAALDHAGLAKPISNRLARLALKAAGMSCRNEDLASILRAHNGGLTVLDDPQEMP